MTLLLSLIATVFSIFFLVLGQEIGGHRYFSHRTFKCNYKWRYTFHFLLALGNFGSALDWQTLHKVHHMHSDTHLDPTSPKHMGFLTLFTNFWKFKFHFYGKHLVVKSLVKILKNTDNYHELIYLRKLHPFITVSYFFILLSCGLEYTIALFCIPTLFVSYTMNSISYFCHDCKTSQPVNNPWINFISFGGGWHKNHHENVQAHIYHSKFDFVGCLVSALFVK